MYQSIIGYKGARYFWVAMALSAVSVWAYWWHQPINSPNGGTWLGYTLGTIGALLIIWLMLLGVRKRSYDSNVGNMQGWTSAHIYLGTALLLIATLHCGIQFGSNIHTLAYVLMVAVILSGFFGIYAYIRYPHLMTDNRAGDTMGDLLGQVQKIDDRSLRETNSEDLRELVESAIAGASIGGGWWRQLTAKDHSTVIIPHGLNLGVSETAIANSDQNEVIQTLANRLAELSGGEEAAAVQHLLASFAAKQILLRRIRRDVQIRAILKIWLYIHVPLSFGLLAALITHVIVVFYYW